MFGYRKKTMNTEPIDAGMVIIPSGDLRDFLSAYRATKEIKSRLPSNAMFDRMLFDSGIINTEQANLMSSKAQRWWTSTIIAYPAINERFRKGTDLEDMHEGKNAMRWIIPESCVPREALGQKGIGIVMENPHITIESSRVTIEPESMPVVISQMPYVEDYPCGMSTPSRIPVQVSPRESAMMDDYNIRYLSRVMGNGIRPIARSAKGQGKWVVYASLSGNEIAGMSYAVKSGSQGHLGSDISVLLRS